MTDDPKKPEADGCFNNHRQPLFWIHQDYQLPDDFSRSSAGIIIKILYQNLNYKIKFH